MARSVPPPRASQPPQRGVAPRESNTWDNSMAAELLKGGQGGAVAPSQDTSDDWTEDEWMVNTVRYCGVVGGMTYSRTCVI